MEKSLLKRIKNKLYDTSVAIGGKFSRRTDDGRRKIKKHGRRLHRNIFIITILTVPVVHWLVFWLYVNLNSILLAFRAPGSGEWGFSNFPLFWDLISRPGGELLIATKNTLIYFFSGIFIATPLTLVITYFIFKRIFGFKAFRVIYYLPVVISGIVMTMMFREAMKPWGIFGSLLGKFGVSPSGGFLGNSGTATPTIVFFGIWTGFGGGIMLYGGAMSRVPLELFESAKLDGCKPMRELLSIILPLIWPTISTQLIFAMTGIFTAGGAILPLTNGAFNTTTISFWIFNKLRGDGYGLIGGQYEIIATAGLFFTVLGVPIILLSRWLLEKIRVAEY